MTVTQRMLAQLMKHIINIQNTKMPEKSAWHRKRGL